MANKLIPKVLKAPHMTEPEGKSKGIADDFAVRKVEQTQELVVSKSIMPSDINVNIGEENREFNQIWCSTGVMDDILYIGTPNINGNLFTPNEGQTAHNIAYWLPIQGKAGFLYCDGDLAPNGGYMSWTSCPPIGTIIMYPSNTAPAGGWLLCDGTEKNGADPDLAALYALIGTTFGVGGGGPDYFLLPDFRLRFPVGGDVAGGIRPVGTTGGSTAYTPQGTINAHTQGNVTLAGMIPNVLTGPLIHGFTGTAATIEPPYLAINFFIKY